MKKIRQILTGLLVVSISFLFIDAGRTITFTGNLQTILVHNHTGDSEIPDEQVFTRSGDDDTWTVSGSSLFLQSADMPDSFYQHIQTGTEDYYGLIWQPPK